MICVVGASILDINGAPKAGLQLAECDSIPSDIYFSDGGVGRNIAENLQRLGVDTHLISAFGEDAFGQMLIQSLDNVGVDYSTSLFSNEHSSAVHLATLNEAGDMVYGLAGLSIMKTLDVDFLVKQKSVFEKAKIIIAETNLAEESLMFLWQNYREKLVIDLVTAHFAKKVIPIQKGLLGVKGNRAEIEVLSSCTIQNEKDCKLALERLRQNGVANICMTAGSDGVYFSTIDGNEYGKMGSFPIKIKNTIGAGDAFMAGWISQLHHNKNFKAAVQYGVAAAAIALQSDEPVSPEMNPKNVEALKNKIQ